MSAVSADAERCAVLVSAQVAELGTGLRDMRLQSSVSLIGRESVGAADAARVHAAMGAASGTVRASLASLLAVGRKHPRDSRVCIAVGTTTHACRLDLNSSTR